MKALWAGVCWQCESTWDIGDDIGKRDGEWMHAACAGTDDE